MTFYGFLSLFGAAFLIIPQVLAQDTAVITDPATGFIFPGAQVVKYDPPVTNGALSFGVAFPKSLDKDEYIGYLAATRPKGAGWTGISHTSAMSKSLLLVAWADGQDVVTSFRYAKDYKAPVQYTGTGTTLTPLSHSVNTTHFSLTYRCQKCLSWDQGGKKGNQSMKGDSFQFGWAQGSKNPNQPKVATSVIGFHDLGFGVLPFEPKVAANVNYDTMAATAPKKATSGGAKTPAKGPVPAKGAGPAKGTVPAKGPSSASSKAPAKGKGGDGL